MYLMKRYLFACALLAMMSLTACGGGDRQLEYALQFAGSNRGELEKVLLHYQDDDLKLKAAEFLVLNMVGHSVPTLTSVEKYKSFYRRCDSIRDEYKSTH